jgi:antitoxin YefM
MPPSRQSDGPSRRSATQRHRRRRTGATTRIHVSSRPRLSVYPIVYTLGVAKYVPVREFRSRLSELLDDVADRRDHILVTRNGRPAAALVPIDEYQALEETAEILSDPGAIAAIETGLAELNRGDTVTLDALRDELAERRRAF